MPAASESDPIQPVSSPSNRHDDRIHDVLVIGGGPAGSSCAYWLADAGWDVALVERKQFPRVKTCGDGLTPRSVRQLQDMGLGGAIAGAHRYEGLRACAYGRQLELQWPAHPSFPSHGYVVTRHDLDQMVVERAAKAGAAVHQKSEAVEPLLSPPQQAGQAGSAGGLPRCVGALVRHSSGEAHPMRARYVVIADGANSRFGRALGTARRRDWPMGMALRGYYRSPRSEDRFIESHLDIRDASGAVVPGYGWIFPLGDGRVNVGVGLLSVAGRWKGINTSTLMETFVASAHPSWGLSPESCCGPPTGGKLPMGLAVGPRVGPNVVAVGDAAGSINPFNGEGIAYGYETGRLAAASIGQALAGGGDEALGSYEQQLQEAYGLYYDVARAFVDMISQPGVMQACIRMGMHSHSLMALLLRVMANLLRPSELGPAEGAYLALAATGRLVHRLRVPDWQRTGLARAGLGESWAGESWAGED